MDKFTFRTFAEHGLAAAAIAAGLTLLPVSAMAEEQPAADPAPVDAAPAATTEASSDPAQELQAAQSEQSSAQASYDQAVANEAQKQAASDAANQAVQAAENDVSAAQNAQAAASQAQQAAQSADSAATTAEQNAAAVPDVSDAELLSRQQASDNAAAEAQQAAADATSAQQAYDSAKAQDDKVQQFKAEAKQDLDAKTAAKEDAEQALNTAKSALTQAEEQHGTKLADAKSDLDVADTAYQASEEAVTAANDAYKEATSNYNTAESDAATKQSELAQAQRDYDAAKKAQDDAQAAYDNYNYVEFEDTDEGKRLLQQLNDATSQVNSYSSQLSDAKSERDSAKNTLDDLQQQLQSAENAAGSGIQADASQGSLGFFRYLAKLDSSNQEAVNLLTDAGLTGKETASGMDGKNFLDYTHIGAKGDATSLDNVKRALEFIKECNDIRAKDPENRNLQPLNVNTFLMALAEINANWTYNYGTDSNVKAHARKAGETSYKTGENAACSRGYKGKDDPFDGWYTRERKEYLAGQTGKAGHYLNIVNISTSGADRNYACTGFGVNTNLFGATPMDARYIQQFGWSNFGHGVTYAYDNFLNLFNAYYDAAKNANARAGQIASLRAQVAQAQSAYDAKQQRVDELSESLSAAEQNKNVADKAYNTGRIAYESKDQRANLWQQVMSAQTTKEQAQTALSKARTASEIADANLAAASTLRQQKYNAAVAAGNDRDAKLAARQNAQSAYDYVSSGQDIAAAQEAVNDAQTAYDQAVDDYYYALRIYDDAQGTGRGTSEALAEAQSSLTAAQDRLADAQEGARTAWNAYQWAKFTRANKTNQQRQAAEARNRANAADAKYSSARSAANAAQAKADAAQGRLPQLRTNADQARNQLDAAKRAVSDARTRLDSANVRLAVAQAAYNQATQAAKNQAKQAANSQKKPSTSSQAKQTSSGQAKQTPSSQAKQTPSSQANQTTSGQAVKTVDLYRVYDPSTGEHLYTTHMEEVQHLQGLGWSFEESQTKKLPSSGTPVWRLYQPSTGDHHYTSDTNETHVMTTQWGWVFDFGGDPAFYGADKSSGLPFYRIYDTTAPRFGHLFTGDANEKSVHMAEGHWNDEGIAWYTYSSAPEARTASVPMDERDSFQCDSRPAPVTSPTDECDSRLTPVTSDAQRDSLLAPVTYAAWDPADRKQA